MIYTVTFNPSLDYVVRVNNFTKGVVNRTTEEQILPGGKGVNVSIVSKNLGHESRALGFCAGFTGREFKKILNEKSLEEDFILVSDGMTRINVKISSEEETEVNGMGPVITSQDMEQLFKKLLTLKDEDILVLAGSTPAGVPKSIYMDIMEALSDRKVKVVVDATGELLLNVLKYKPFLIKPNHHELGELFGVTIQNKQDVITYAAKLQEMGARNVLVSMAGEGAVLLTETGTIYQSPAPKGIVKNSVGAGDSMVAGFLSGYLETGDYANAYMMGVCAGSASAFSKDLATRAEVEQLMEGIKWEKNS